MSLIARNSIFDESLLSIFWLLLRIGLFSPYGLFEIFLYIKCILKTSNSFHWFIYHFVFIDIVNLVRREISIQILFLFGFNFIRYLTKSLSIQIIGFDLRDESLITRNVTHFLFHHLFPFLLLVSLRYVSSIARYYIIVFLSSDHFEFKKIKKN